ncbi:hypothetical protein [Emticicia fluvialis]|uniref:hypothetical protein n=1 Tax=Emticicia fluvialis TaxID=2974474 RepID=UPI002165ABBB|nr:hypothetical protein [Emticicia fluvialis]
MKTGRKFKFASLSLVMALAVSMYNCKSKDAEPEIPKFEEKYKDVKLPDVKPTTPAAVTTTQGSVTASATTTAVTTALATGTVTSDVTTAAANVEKVIAPSEAGKISAAFTPAVVSNLVSTGTLPADLKASVQAIALNPALAAYLPKITLPSVNGTVVTGFVKESSFTKNESLIKFPDYAVAAVNSACTDSAQLAFNRAKATIDAARATQEQTVNATYANRVAAANSAACIATAGTSFSTRNTTANNLLQAGLTALASVKDTLGEANYNLLTVLLYVNFVQTIELSGNLYAAEVNACNLTTTATIAAAASARDTDLAAIANAYNTTITNMQATLTASFQTCHDQGQG